MAATLNHFCMFIIGYQLWKQILTLKFIFPKDETKQQQVNDINNYFFAFFIIQRKIATFGSTFSKVVGL